MSHLLRTGSQSIKNVVRGDRVVWSSSLICGGIILLRKSNAYARNGPLELEETVAAYVEG